MDLNDDDVAGSACGDKKKSQRVNARPGVSFLGLKVLCVPK